MADFASIYDHIVVNNPDAALAILEDLIHRIFELARLGVTGSYLDWVRKDYEDFPIVIDVFTFELLRTK